MTRILSLFTVYVIAHASLGPASAEVTTSLQLRGAQMAFSSSAQQVAFGTPAVRVGEAAATRPVEEFSSSSQGPTWADVATGAITRVKSFCAQRPRTPSVMSTLSDLRDVKQQHHAEEVHRDSHGFSWLPIGTRPQASAPARTPKRQQEATPQTDSYGFAWLPIGSYLREDSPMPHTGSYLRGESPMPQD